MSEIADQIKSSLNVKEVLEYYGIEFDKKGFANCPFHNEKTASLSTKRKRYTCFGCGENGDVIDFVAKYFNLSFQQAITRLNCDFDLGLTMNKKISYRAKREQAENAKIINAFNQWKIQSNKKYLQLSAAHSALFKQLQQEPENKTLADYVFELDLLLDQNIEEVRF